MKGYGQKRLPRCCVGHDDFPWPGLRTRGSRDAANRPAKRRARQQGQWEVAQQHRESADLPGESA